MPFDDHDWYAPRYPGPPINIACLSLRIAMDDSIAQTDQRSRCWDELCDDHPELVGWTERLRAARGDANVTWTFVETDGAPTLRITRARNVVCTFSDDLVIGPQDDGKMKDMLIETMAVCARAFGVAPPPVGTLP